MSCGKLISQKAYETCQADINARKVCQNTVLLWINNYSEEDKAKIKSEMNYWISPETASNRICSESGTQYLSEKNMELIGSCAAKYLDSVACSNLENLQNAFLSMKGCQQKYAPID